MSNEFGPNCFEFLIKLNSEYFLSAIDGHQLTGTHVPSAAFHADYRAADRICSKLRVHGYKQACVTNQLGEPVTAAMLRGSVATAAKSTVPAPIEEPDKILAGGGKHASHAARARHVTD